MKPATNIRELPNSFLPNFPLMQGRDEALYVPIYEDEIADLRDSILYDNIAKQTLFVSGQTGTGKTTALHFLPDEEIKEVYEVIFLNAKELFELSDVSIVEILLMICHKLMDKDPSKKLAKEFREEIERLDKVQKGILSEETTKEKGIEGKTGGGIEAQLGGNPIARLLSLFKLSGNFFANLQLDASYRKITREAFQLNKIDLIRITNRIVDRFRDLVAKDKKLLIIINELDHLKNPQLIHDIFVRDRQFLKDIACKKVVSVPVSLIGEEEFIEDIKYFCIKLKANPLKVNKGDGATIAGHREFLTRLVQNRIAEGHDLIDPKAIDLAIKYSGGILRQYISILHEAAKKVRRIKGEKVHPFNIEDGMRTFRQILERSVVINKEKIDILDEVRRKYQTNYSGKETFNECLLGNQILVYMNDPTWYSVNPLIEETIEIYAKKESQS